MVPGDCRGNWNPREGQQPFRLNPNRTGDRTTTLRRLLIGAELTPLVMIFVARSSSAAPMFLGPEIKRKRVISSFKCLVSDHPIGLINHFSKKNIPSIVKITGRYFDDYDFTQCGPTHLLFVDFPSNFGFHKLCHNSDFPADKSRQCFLTNNLTNFYLFE